MIPIIVSHERLIVFFSPVALHGHISLVILKLKSSTETILCAIIFVLQVYWEQEQSHFWVFFRVNRKGVLLLKLELELSYNKLYETKKVTEKIKKITHKLLAID